jgi:hypothetical protein
MNPLHALLTSYFFNLYHKETEDFKSPGTKGSEGILRLRCNGISTEESNAWLAELHTCIVGMLQHAICKD